MFVKEIQEAVREALPEVRVAVERARREPSPPL